MTEPTHEPPPNRPPAKTLTYSGDVTGNYNHDRGTGTVGKIVGPQADGRYYLIYSATFDPDICKTRCYLEPIPNPDYFFNRTLQGGSQ